MEPDGSETERDPNLPRPVPPPLPPLPAVSYFAASPEERAGWVIVWSCKSVSEWHSANKIISRHGIIARMQMSQGESSDVDLLVLQTEVEWARDLLSKGLEAVADQPTGGFPLFDTIVPTTSSEYVRAIPAQVLGLTEARKVRYTFLILALWIVVTIILLLMVWAVFYGWSN